MKVIALLLVGATVAAAFAPAGPLALSQPCRSAGRAAVTSIRMGKSFEQKEDILDTVRNRLESAQLIFSTDLKGINMPEINKLRGSLPEGSSAIVIKNRLLKRAITGTKWVEAEKMATNSNLWIIVDEDFKGSIQAFKDWGKVAKKGEINGGVLESTLYDSQGVLAIGDLPSKEELYAQIAGSINAVPSMLAYALKEVPQKTARAIKLAFVPDE